ncbi:ThuA domain-containing protein [Lignipirellula cremea]|uniref:Trehalose utilization n=1 Tax=Lignipirellula cremea TaxID=2528010 RepID=A0A518E2D8_9BACT|nr:ThuA domain-containing protein [Lignipirellula cremea]QDU98233.1 Trehalose utilization [Lignipirellula cremea]
MRFRPCLAAVLLLLSVAVEVVAEDPGAKISVLIVDGQNNHDWQATSPVIAKFLSESDRFVVERATTPPRGEDLSGFRPRFSSHQVVLLNYNGLVWPEATCRDLVDFVSRGGGLVVFHAADNAFPKWDEYNAMIGLGGWGGRSEASGPYLRLRDGKWEPDNTPGAAGKEHGAAPFLVETFAPEHPIMKGLPTKWLHARDQLVFNLRGPAENVEVLAMAFSPDEKGINDYTPMAFTVKYGEGRVFHTPMGHDLTSITCQGFVTLMRRGVEWAATGNVTIPPPSNFPTAEETSSWKPREAVATEASQPAEPQP